MMEEITTFLERIAERQSSFILFGNAVYAIVESNGSPDFLEAGGARLSLAKSLSFADFERLDEKVQSSEILKYCSSYVKEAINSELKADDDVRKEKNRIHALNFIMTEFLPFLLSKKYESDNLLLSSLNGGKSEEIDPVGRAKAEIAAKLEKDFGKGEIRKGQDPVKEMRENLLKREKSQLNTGPIIPAELTPKDFGLKADDLEFSLLGQITGNQPLYALDGKVFALKPAGRKDYDFVFTLNGKPYVPSGESTLALQHLSAQLLDRYKRTLRISALEKSQDAFEEVRGQIKADDVTEKQMHELAKLSEYDFGDCGFVLKDGRYSVYSRTPKFATQDGRKPEVFWPFDATRVAIDIGWERGRPYSADKPRIVERREFHPCLSDRARAGGFCELCNLNREPGAYKNTVLDMVRKLSDAVNTFLQPMNLESLNAHIGYTYFGAHLDNILRQGSLTRAEAEKKGYMIVEVIAKDIK